ncbi:MULTISPECIES: hypothetical protein [unclassified Brevibacterium]|uniref:hypothetical protein n=1 Tax=unclassified Brevibacterium TaxID=2614124 RepID=UPI001E515BF2|nr:MULTISPECIES: hypothetical protein [unclassified Brevibacterium]MDK8434264.1 hypothetical protein [Brevibacterium sp. H-BE7]
MSDQNELRDRIAKVHFANSARLAAEQLDLDKPVEWGEITDHDRAQLLDSAQAIIDVLDLTVEPHCEECEHKVIAGWWEKQ